ncbi:MAG: sigma-70 family RNA polymerase sigma factor [Clostridia bacterium]|nr:sigma-70 family RNA polymerase sigma factor [Clostridia bacterium]
MDKKSQWLDDLHRRYYDTLIVKGNAHIDYDPVLRGSVEDCVSEAFLTAWEKADKVKRSENPYLWLLGTVYKKLDNLRTKSSTKTSQRAVPLEAEQAIKVCDPDAERRMEAWYTENELKDVLKRLTDLLSQKECEVYNDYFVREKRAKEISREQGMTLGAVRAAIRRIREKAERIRNQNLLVIWLAVSTLFALCQIHL